ncbi:MAG: hypothetical protein ACD_63C00069G0001 [uncultured bacterium]|nr:MAG: hypothetical protein ACD_63C00069G0001 [uncultured bacterium]
MIKNMRPEQPDFGISEEYEYYIELGKRRSLELSQKRGFEVGDIVANIDDTPPNDFAWKIKEIFSGGKIAMIHLPDGTEKKVDIDKLFDPNLALQEAKSAQVKELMKKHRPQDLN